MKIISKFKDFYDGGAVYGVDTERIYVREKKTLDKPDIKYNNFNYLGFCGNIYILKDYSYKIFQNWDKHPKDSILWEEDALKFNLSKNIDGKLIREKAWKHWDRGLEYYRNQVKGFNIFLKYKVPIFFIGVDVDGDKYENKLILNPKLSNFYFQQFYGTVETFQKIEQYISNQLVSELQPDTPVGGNEVLGRSKGFDEYSFRHTNTKKKPKKF